MTIMTYRLDGITHISHHHITTSELDIKTVLLTLWLRSYDKYNRSAAYLTPIAFRDWVIHLDMGGVCALNRMASQLTAFYFRKDTRVSNNTPTSVSTPLVGSLLGINAVKKLVSMQSKFYERKETRFDKLDSVFRVASNEAKTWSEGLEAKPQPCKCKKKWSLKYALHFFVFEWYTFFKIS